MHLLRCPLGGWIARARALRPASPPARPRPTTPTPRPFFPPSAVAKIAGAKNAPGLITLTLVTIWWGTGRGRGERGGGRDAVGAPSARGARAPPRAPPPPPRPSARPASPPLSPPPSQSSGFGPLGPGILLHLTTSHARALAAPEPPPALAALGAALAFDLAAGANGRAWVGGADAGAVVAVAAALAESEFVGADGAAAIAARAVAAARAAAR